MTQLTTDPPQRIEAGDRSFPLHEFHLAAAGREWTIQHTGVVLTRDDEFYFLGELKQHLPYGVALWPSGIALAYEVAERGADVFLGSNVLELGAGTGLPGIVAATLGARVVQTDRQDVAMSLCRSNGRRNGVEKRVDYQLVDWTDWQGEPQRYDWIFGSDILYGEEMHGHLRHIFETSLKPSGRVLLSDPLRGTSMELLESLQAEGWKVSGTRWNLGDERDPRVIGVFELSR